MPFEEGERLFNQQKTTLIGFGLSYAGYTYPDTPIDSIAIGSMFSPDHRGFDNASGTFTGMVNGACPSFGLPDPRCGTTVATPAEAKATGSIAIGQNAKVLTTGASNSQQDVTAGEFGIAIGSSSEVTGYHGVAVGLLSQASGIAATAYGPEARAQALQAIAVGDISTASGERSIAIGALTTANSAFATALGYASSAVAQTSVAIGAASTASGDLSTALGGAAEASETGALAVGSQAIATGAGSAAIGYQSNSSGVRSVALGTQAVASGVSSIAAGDVAIATGTGSTAIGPGSAALADYSTAIGFGAISNEKGLMVLGGPNTTAIKVSSLGGSGTALIGASSDGTLQRSSVSLGQMQTAVNTKIPKLESAARGLGRAVESSGAIAAAMSAVPEVTLEENEPMRCGVGTGGFGSQYAVSAGCAVRVGERLHLNGALSYSPSIDYDYGSTPSVAGRLGFSFPLGRIAKATTKNDVAQADASPTLQAYLSEPGKNSEIEALKQENKEIRKENKDIKEELTKLKKMIQMIAGEKTKENLLSKQINN